MVVEEVVTDPVVIASVVKEDLLQEFVMPLNVVNAKEVPDVVSLMI
jgi:hypothetical protein